MGIPPYGLIHLQPQMFPGGGALLPIEDEYLTAQSQPRGSSLACVLASFQGTAEQESTKGGSCTALWSQRKSRNRISTQSPLGVHTCPPALCEKPMLCASHLGQHHPHSCSDI